MGGYGVTAPFYDAIAAGQRPTVDEQFRAALRPLREEGRGVVVDIGAGTGLSTALIADVLPGIEIFAVEPDAQMRAALLTRVWSSEDLRRRVSILPLSVLDAPLPAAIGGAVGCASLVHFSPADRDRLWRLLADRLAPGGRAVFDIQCPEAIDVPQIRMASTTVGRVTYEGWARAEKLEGGRQRWLVTYATRYEGRELERRQAEHLCWAVSAETLSHEVRARGLTAEASGDLVVIRRPAG